MFVNHSRKFAKLLQMAFYLKNLEIRKAENFFSKHYYKTENLKRVLFLLKI